MHSHGWETVDLHPLLWYHSGLIPNLTLRLVVHSSGSPIQTLASGPPLGPARISMKPMKLNSTWPSATNRLIVVQVPPIRSHVEIMEGCNPLLLNLGLPVHSLQSLRSHFSSGRTSHRSGSEHRCVQGTIGSVKGARTVSAGDHKQPPVGFR